MSLSEFFYMGGYAVFVWPSYALALIVLTANIVFSLMKGKQVRRMITRRLKVRRNTNDTTT